MSTTSNRDPRRASLNGYVECWDSTYNRYYYYNEQTGQSSWEHPRTFSQPTPPPQQQQQSVETITTTPTETVMPSVTTTPTQPIVTQQATEMTSVVQPTLIVPTKKQFTSADLSSDVNRLSLNSTPNSPDNLSFNDVASAMKKKKKATTGYKTSLSISQQFAAIASKECELQEELDDAFAFDPDQPLTTREKFLILHLSNLTCTTDNVFTDIMENELRLNILLRACLHSKSGKLVIDMVRKAPELVQVTLPTSGLSIAHLLASTGNDRALDFICHEYKVLIDQPAHNNLTPLHLASLFGSEPTIRLLLAHRAFIETECTALPHLKKIRENQGGLLGVLHYWKDHVWFKGEKSDSYNVGSLLLAKVEHYITPLLMATIGGSSAAVKTLILSRAMIDWRSPNELMRVICDPFTLSCVMGHDSLVQFLLDSQKELNIRFDVDLKDMNGNTPLMLNSKSYGSGPVVEVLCTANANINQIETYSGNNALHMAIANGQPDVLRGFVKKKKGTEDLAVLINACNMKQLFTPLQLAYELHDNKSLPELEYKAFYEMLIKNDAKERKVYSEVVKEGWLYKEGHVYKTVRQRWFILRKSGTLSYYKDIRKLKSPSGEIQLYKAFAQKEPSKKGSSTAPLCFSIQDNVSNKLTYIFADKEDVRDQWLDAVNFCISIAKNPHPEPI